MTTAYEIRVMGVIGPAARDALRHLSVDVHPTIDVQPTAGSRGITTVIYGEMDTSGLHEVLDRVRAFGLELVEIHHRPTDPG